jgi:hypothetical protein
LVKPSLPPAALHCLNGFVRGQEGAGERGS